MSIIKRKAGSIDVVKSVLEFDKVPTEGSPNLVESGAVAKAIGNLGNPLQWKGPATVSELNTGITGIQPGWTYTLTDAGTLTDGSIVVDVGDEVAWTADGEWFKVGGENSKVALFHFTGTDYPDGDAVLAEQNKGKTVVLAKYTSGPGGFWYDYYYLYRRVNGIVGVVSATYLEFFPADNSKQYIKAFKDLDAAEPEWVWTLEDVKVTLAEAIAPDYDPTSTYPTVGTAVMHNGKRYVSNTAINTAEDWTLAHWTQKSVEEEIGNARGPRYTTRTETATTLPATINVNDGESLLYNVNRVPTDTQIYTIKAPAGTTDAQVAIISQSDFFTSFKVMVNESEIPLFDLRIYGISLNIDYSNSIVESLNEEGSGVEPPTSFDEMGIADAVTGVSTNYDTKVRLHTYKVLVKIVGQVAYILSER